MMEFFRRIGLTVVGAIDRATGGHVKNATQGGRQPPGVRRPEKPQVHGIKGLTVIPDLGPLEGRFNRP